MFSKLLLENCKNFVRMYFLMIIVSATKGRRDIKIPLFLSVPVQKILIELVRTVDAYKSVPFMFQFVKPILHTITHLIQYTVLKIRFWSVECTIGTIAEISSIFTPSYQVMQAIVMVYENKTTSKCL